jgi:hypothetical protein
LTVTVEVPSAMVPAKVTAPSSTSNPPTVRVPEVVIVYGPVASLPAEKIAVSPSAHVVVADVPVGSVVHFDPTVSHVPVGLGPPAPAVSALLSQYLVLAACELNALNARHSASLGRVILFIDLVRSSKREIRERKKLSAARLREAGMAACPRPTSRYGSGGKSPTLIYGLSR